MDIERIIQRLRHLQDCDQRVWESLYRDHKRRNTLDVAAQKLAQIGESLDENRRQSWLERAQEWHQGPVRAFAKDMMSGDFRLIPAGQFLMGSPENEAGRFDNETQHPVEISRPFLLKTTPVTQSEWLALMGNNPSHFSSNHKICPVETVSWFDALAYCNALSETEGLTRCYDLSSCTGTPGAESYTGPPIIDCDLSANGYRLPTEAEWEYAARAGSTAAFYNGSAAALEQLAWCQENAASSTHPVKEKAANAWGLYDMLGNVWEWCQDWYDTYPTEPQRDPIGPGSSYRVSYRVLRGGSWNDSARNARAADRHSLRPSSRYVSVGFRPARSNF